MACMASPAIDVREAVREAVLAALGDSEPRPMELLTRLGGLGYSDSDIQGVLSTLLHEGEIELTSQRILKLRSQAA